jgi:hypothetical protein
MQLLTSNDSYASSPVNTIETYVPDTAEPPFPLLHAESMEAANDAD